MTMMDISILLLTILLFGHNKVVGENTTATAGDYTVEVLGQSGKINLKQVSTGKRILQVSPDSLDEYENAADTKVVGKHSFSKFPTEDFKFSTLKDDTLYNASVKKVTFTTTITSMSNAEVSFDMYLFMENKTITVESGEEYEVKEGSVKFNVNINKWPFCGTGTATCGGKNGNFLDFSIEVKGMNSGDKAGRAKVQKGKKGKSIGKEPTTYQMGNGLITLSSLYKVNDTVNGTWTNMPDGFPKTTQKGSKTYFIFRFAKFESSVTYDPIMDVDNSGSTPDATSTPPVSTPTTSTTSPANSAWSMFASTNCIFFGLVMTSFWYHKME